MSRLNGAFATDSTVTTTGVCRVPEEAMFCTLGGLYRAGRPVLRGAGRNRCQGVRRRASGTSYAVTLSARIRRLRAGRDTGIRDTGRWACLSVDGCEFRLRGCDLKDGVTYPDYREPQYFIGCISRRKIMDFSGRIKGYSRRVDYNCRCAPHSFFHSGPGTGVGRRQSDSCMRPIGDARRGRVVIPPSFVPLRCFGTDLTRFRGGPLCGCLYEIFNRTRTREMFRLCRINASTG